MVRLPLRALRICTGTDGISGLAGSLLHFTLRMQQESKPHRSTFSLATEENREKGRSKGQGFVCRLRKPGLVSFYDSSDCVFASGFRGLRAS